ncbi:MAG: hypothetical protein APF80_10455 [Alphaproteobacteria bacterium BRH_c36]|nr:MAG: hypothetical protein APF80_10455 [Alphaproteobacteria bacterium BRH_c36]
MNKTMQSGIALTALIGLTAPAAALSFMNNDEANYTVIVTIGEQQTEFAMDAGATVQAACGESCSIVLIGPDGDLDQMDAVEADQLIVTTGIFQKTE